MTRLISTLAGVVAVIFVLVPHEVAHAYVAYKCGDPTAKMKGRLTLNPIKHLDVAGFLLCIFTGFGWAKPVPIYPYNFKNYRRGLFLTAIAGVVTNYIIAFIAYPLFIATNMIPVPDNQTVEFFITLLQYIFYLIFAYSLSVFIFNLLPLYPLDGFRIVESFTREINPVRRFLKNYGYYILIILVLESYLCGILQEYASMEVARYFDILGYIHWFAENIIGFPITGLWDAVFGLPVGIDPLF